MVEPYNLFGVRGGTISGGKLERPGVGRDIWKQQKEQGQEVPGAGTYAPAPYLSPRGPDKSISVKFGTAHKQHSRDLWKKEENHAREVPGVGTHTRSESYSIRGAEKTVSVFFGSAHMGHGRDLWKQQEDHAREVPAPGRYSPQTNTIGFRLNGLAKELTPSYMAATARSRARVTPRKSPSRSPSAASLTPSRQWNRSVKTAIPRLDGGSARPRSAARPKPRDPVESPVSARSSSSRRTSERRNPNRPQTIVMTASAARLPETFPSDSNTRRRSLGNPERADRPADLVVSKPRPRSVSSRRTDRARDVVLNSSATARRPKSERRNVDSGPVVVVSKSSSSSRRSSLSDRPRPHATVLSQPSQGALDRTSSPDKSDRGLIESTTPKRDARQESAHPPDAKTPSRYPLETNGQDNSPSKALFMQDVRKVPQLSDVLRPAPTPAPAPAPRVLTLEEKANELFRSNIAWAMEQPASLREFAL
jgi:hypothetical protein